MAAQPPGKLLQCLVPRIRPRRMAAQLAERVLQRLVPRMRRTGAPVGGSPVARGRSYTAQSDARQELHFTD
eukprot:NODE_4851_length_634_cov_285.461140.p2 GENE.NODE_4851_length_634_cov_285.461140~~NODE_4851_length_634_cov_285.461140.p2  ORF type:complete len:71 (-),score=10.52 NODE_4851_length_634_cov_285.461140:241-453(-)